MRKGRSPRPGTDQARCRTFASTCAKYSRETEGRRQKAEGRRRKSEDAKRDALIARPFFCTSLFRPSCFQNRIRSPPPICKPPSVRLSSPPASFAEPHVYRAIPPTPHFLETRYVTSTPRLTPAVVLVSFEMTGVPTVGPGSVVGTDETTSCETKKMEGPPEKPTSILSVTGIIHVASK